jgi:hypothetical protein
MTCDWDHCSQPTRDTYCYYHAKVMDGLITADSHLFAPRHITPRGKAKLKAITELESKGIVVETGPAIHAARYGKGKVPEGFLREVTL